MHKNAQYNPLPAAPKPTPDPFPPTLAVGRGSKACTKMHNPPSQSPVSPRNRRKALFPTAWPFVERGMHAQECTIPPPSRASSPCNRRTALFPPTWPFVESREDAQKCTMTLNAPLPATHSASCSTPWAVRRGFPTGSQPRTRHVPPPERAIPEADTGAFFPLPS